MSGVLHGVASSRAFAGAELPKPDLTRARSVCRTPVCPQAPTAPALRDVPPAGAT
jgi:hypothetical protein